MGIDGTWISKVLRGMVDERLLRLMGELGIDDSMLPYVRFAAEQNTLRRLLDVLVPAHDADAIDDAHSRAVRDGALALCSGVPPKDALAPVGEYLIDHEQLLFRVPPTARTQEQRIAHIAARIAACSQRSDVSGVTLVRDIREYVSPAKAVESRLRARAGQRQLELHPMSATDRAIVERRIVGVHDELPRQLASAMAHPHYRRGMIALDQTVLLESVAAAAGTTVRIGNMQVRVAQVHRDEHGRLHCNLSQPTAVVGDFRGEADAHIGASTPVAFETVDGDVVGIGLATMAQREMRGELPGAAMWMVRTLRKTLLPLTQSVWDVVLAKTADTDGGGWPAATNDVLDTASPAALAEGMRAFLNTNDDDDGADPGDLDAYAAAVSQAADAHLQRCTRNMDLVHGQLDDSGVEAVLATLRDALGASFPVPRSGRAIAIDVPRPPPVQWPNVLSASIEIRAVRSPKLGRKRKRGASPPPEPRLAQLYTVELALVTRDSIDLRALYSVVRARLPVPRAEDAVLSWLVLNALTKSDYTGGKAPYLVPTTVWAAFTQYPSRHVPLVVTVPFPSPDVASPEQLDAQARIGTSRTYLDVDVEASVARILDFVLHAYRLRLGKRAAQLDWTSSYDSVRAAAAPGMRAKMLDTDQLLSLLRRCVYSAVEQATMPAGQRVAIPPMPPGAPVGTVSRFGYAVGTDGRLECAAAAATADDDGDEE